MTIGIIYIGLLIVGVVYAVLTGVLGWVSDLGGDIHIDLSGHLDAGHIHPISGTIVATFVTGFGAGGVVGDYVLHWSLVAGLALAAGSGLALAGAAFVVLDFLFHQTQAGSEFDAQGNVDREAEVITTIPPGGLGEIAYVVKGQRESASARASDGEGIARGRIVVIERVTGSVAHVREKRG
jgi:hypothetical protein